MVFNDRVALVTGGNRGIGTAIVDELAAHGATVYYTFRSENERVTRDLEDSNTIHPIKLDITLLDQVQTAIGSIIEKHGRLDFLVNNAGILADKALAMMSPDHWLSVIDTNLNACFYTCRHVIKQMMKQKFGKIVNIASTGGLFPPAYQSNYAASKAGVIAMTRSLAKEVAAYKITVNAVAPGFIKTDMIDRLTDKKAESYRQHIPMKRFGEPGEVAQLTQFLLSEKADYITGEIIKIDGGLCA